MRKLIRKIVFLHQFETELGFVSYCCTSSCAVPSEKMRIFFGIAVSVTTKASCAAF